MQQEHSYETAQRHYQMLYETLLHQIALVDQEENQKWFGVRLVFSVGRQHVHP